MGLKSEGLLCGVKLVVLDVKLKHRLLLNSCRSLRIKKCKASIEQLTACQCNENDLGKRLLQKTKFLSKLYICRWKIRSN
jgi:hypothetical protein